MNDYDVYFLQEITDLESDYDVSKEGIKLSHAKFSINWPDKDEKCPKKADCRIDIEISGYIIPLPWKLSARDGKSLDGMVVAIDKENKVVEKYCFENARYQGAFTFNQGKATTNLTITADKFIVEDQFSTHVLE